MKYFSYTLNLSKYVFRCDVNIKFSVILTNFKIRVDSCQGALAIYISSLIK